MSAERGGLVGALFRHRKLIAGVGAVWLALVIGGGVFTSTLDARVGLHVFGPTTWYAHDGSVIRIGLHDLEFSRFAPLGAVRANFEKGHGEQPDRDHVPSRPTVMTEHAGPFVQGALVPPGVGAWTLVLTARTPDGGEATVRVPITVLPGSAPVTPPLRPKERKPLKPDVGPLKLDIAPLDQVLPGDLPTQLAVIAHDPDGRPRSLGVHLHLQEGRSAIDLPSAVTTDRHGLATLPIKAIEPRFWIDLSADGGTASWRIQRTPTQFVLDTPSPRVARGATVPFSLQSLHRKGPVFLDLWHGDVWLRTSAMELVDRRAEGELTLPSLPDPSIVWIQAYQTAYLPQKARGGRHLLVTTLPPVEANRWLASQLVAQGIDVAWAGYLAQHADGDPTLTRALLGRFDRPERDPPLLADSSDSARQTVASLKLTWQRRFAWALLGSGVLMIIVIALVLRQNSREVQAAWTEAGGGEEALQGTRKGAAADALYIFLVLAVFLLGLMQLLLRIRW
ncbi:MAG: hypothetical protein H6702_19460 [Myxococcales bacterium]|nr:hypothetical protein [Myxococcales bacterium]